MKTTSAEVKGAPSCHLTSSRRVKSTIGSAGTAAHLPLRPFLLVFALPGSPANPSPPVRDRPPPSPQRPHRTPPSRALPCSGSVARHALSVSTAFPSRSTRTMVAGTTVLASKSAAISCDAAIPGSEKVSTSEEPSCRTSVSFQSAQRPRMKKSFPMPPARPSGRQRRSSCAGSGQRSSRDPW